MLGSFSSVTCVNGDPPMSAGTSVANSATSGEEAEQPEKSADVMVDSESFVVGGGSNNTNTSMQSQTLDEFQHSLAKMAEFQGVAPVLGLGTATSSKQLSVKLAPPPADSKKKSLNGSFRARRLKEIKADNVEVFERIRKSVSHYQNDHLRREWQQNLSYLTSISEFPVADDILASSTNIHKHHYDDNGRNCFGPSPRRPNFLKSTTRTEPLPSIPMIPHPIRSIPTSPKKLQLNMAPTFRSLRKAMPQQPSLPPISSPHSVMNAGGASHFGSNDTLPSPRGRSTCPNSRGFDERFTESTTDRSFPHRSSTAAAATKFIGDLHGKQSANEISGDAKYQLLKTGRFVGGTYLVLTVFCGDGVTNPYGFDVFAYQRELQCEYKLSITKEMTHELLDKSTPSSLAAETAAAAGTNLSMQEIARNICDHINFALLGADQGEMMFLAPTVARKCDQAMRFDASPGLVAFCVHQTIELESDDTQNASGQVSRASNTSNKQRLHVFASTCPTKSYPTGRIAKHDRVTGALGLATVSFQVMEKLPPSRCTALSESTELSTTGLKVETTIDELYSIIVFDSRRDQNRVLSIDRVIAAAIQHLHIISVPVGDNVGTLTHELIINSHVNMLLHPCSSRQWGTTTLEKKRSRQQLPHSISQLLTNPVRATILVQSGLIWKGAYLVAEVALDNVDDASYTETWPHQQSRRNLIQDTDYAVVVSVFNANSGYSSRRKLPPERVSMFLERIDALPCEIKLTAGLAEQSIRDQYGFAECMLLFLQLDVDLFGNEIIIFPVLEHATSASASCSTQACDNDNDQATLPLDFLPSRISWEDENISEGDEGAENDGYDNTEATKLSAAIQPYDTDEDEYEDEAEGSYSSYVNQEEADEDSNANAKLQNAECNDEETPERDEDALRKENIGTSPIEPNTSRPWRQGRKIDDRFCLLQGSPGDDLAAVAVSIAVLGQLGTLSRQVHRIL
ncbi:unnamed protein product [Phytophthora fragariaefolia]|uniref:Unnamed protein product n=1 Tax=Phytophthora fragariaefolia TaxID=1490495 RepID=A0A9W6XLG8_9STRA|nr:unnamed protein product [Phytophthora fragariaefolia]